MKKSADLFTMMKKAAALLILLLILAMPLAVFAGTGESLSSSGDKVVMMNDYKVDAPQYGDVVVMFGNVDVQAEVKGSVVVLMGNASVSSRVAGDVVSMMGNITLKDGAEVGGDVVCMGSYLKGPAASVSGEEREFELPNFAQTDFGKLILILLVVSALSYGVFILIIGLPLLMVLKKKARAMANTMEQNIGRKLAVGFLACVGISIISLIFIWTIIAPMVYLAALICASVACSALLGRKLLRLLNLEANLYVEFAAGLTVITLVRLGLILLIPLFSIPGVITFVVLYMIFELLVHSLGLGGVIDTHLASKAGQTD